MSSFNEVTLTQDTKTGEWLVIERFITVKEYRFTDHPSAALKMAQLVPLIEVSHERDGVRLQHHP